jgi:hypothetical protein
MVMTFTGMMFLLAGVLTAVCYMPRIKSDPEDDAAAAAADAGKGAQMSTSGAAEQDDGEDERESLLRSSDS